MAESVLATGLAALPPIGIDPSLAIGADSERESPFVLLEGRAGG